MCYLTGVEESKIMHRILERDAEETSHEYMLMNVDVQNIHRFIVLMMDCDHDAPSAGSVG